MLEWILRWVALITATSLVTFYSFRIARLTGETSIWRWYAVGYACCFILMVLHLPQLFYSTFVLRSSVTLASVLAFTRAFYGLKKSVESVGRTWRS